MVENLEAHLGAGYHFRTPGGGGGAQAAISLATIEIRSDDQLAFLGSATNAVVPDYIVLDQAMQRWHFSLG